VFFLCRQLGSLANTEGIERIQIARLLQEQGTYEEFASPARHLAGRWPLSRLYFERCAHHQPQTHPHRGRLEPTPTTEKLNWWL